MILEPDRPFIYRYLEISYMNLYMLLINYHHNLLITNIVDLVLNADPDIDIMIRPSMYANPY